MIEIAYDGKRIERADDIPRPAALQFVEELHAQFAMRRDDLLHARAERQVQNSPEP
jgi:malate synthase